MSNRKQTQKDSDALIWIYISLIYLQSPIYLKSLKEEWKVL